MKKKVLIPSIIAVAVLAIAGAVWWLFASGHLVYVAQPANTTMATSKVVCNDELVDRYNEAMFVQFRGDDDFASIDEAGVQSIAEEVRSLDGYKDDPTCQTILLFVALYNDDYEAANAANEVLQAQHDEGIYANSNIRGNSMVDSYYDAVDSTVGTGVDEEE